jgi:hypothetical protein
VHVKYSNFQFGRFRKEREHFNLIVTPDKSCSENNHKKVNAGKKLKKMKQIS